MGSRRYRALLGLLVLTAIAVPTGGSMPIIGDAAAWSPVSGEGNQVGPPDPIGSPMTELRPSLLPVAPEHVDQSFTVMIRTDIHARVNAERRDRGRPPLAGDHRLAAIARGHSRHMAESSFIAHTAPAGETLADRYRAAGYSCRIPIRETTRPGGGENIFWIAAPADSLSASEVADRAVSAWLHSPDHRRTLLNPKWRAQGIGISVVRRAGFVQVYITQNLC